MDCNGLVGSTTSYSLALVPLSEQMRGGIALGMSRTRACCCWLELSSVKDRMASYGLFWQLIKWGHNHMGKPYGEYEFGWKQLGS
jgi:hypothetical protein